MGLPNEIQTGRLSAILHKLLNMSVGSPSPTLATDVFPTIALEQDRPEWKFLAGEKLMAGWGVVPASAGVYSHFALQNPAGSGVLAVVERIIMDPTYKDTYLIGLGADYTGVGSWTPLGQDYVRDARFVNPSGTYGKGACICGYFYNAGTFGANGIVISILSGAFLYEKLDLPFVLVPGTSLLVVDNTVNKPFRLSVLWRERAFEPSETR